MTNHNVTAQQSLFCWQEPGVNEPVLVLNRNFEPLNVCNTRRAIDIHEADTVDDKSFKALIRAAIALNRSKAQ